MVSVARNRVAICVGEYAVMIYSGTFWVNCTKARGVEVGNIFPVEIKFWNKSVL